MKEIINIQTISEVHEFLGIEKPKHPLISLIRLADANLDMDLDNQKYALGLYQISLKDSCPFTIVNYGRNSYDYHGSFLVIVGIAAILESAGSITFESDEIKIEPEPDLAQISLYLRPFP